MDRILCGVCLVAVFSLTAAGCSDERTALINDETFVLDEIGDIQRQGRQANWEVAWQTGYSAGQKQIGGAATFSLKVDNEKIYSVRAHCLGCNGCDAECREHDLQCVCVGCIYPYQKKLTRDGGFGALVLQEFFEAMQDGNTAHDSAIKRARRFNWTKFFDTIEAERPRQSANYPFSLDIPMILEHLCDSDFSVTYLRE